MILCNNCDKREGTELWVGEGGVLAHVHGFSRFWCKQCVVEAQLAHCRKSAEQIPELEAKLAAMKGAQ